jgi:hypothetical protein
MMYFKHLVLQSVALVIPRTLRRFCPRLQVEPLIEIAVPIRLETICKFLFLKLFSLDHFKHVEH